MQIKAKLQTVHFSILYLLPIVCIFLSIPDQQSKIKQIACKRSINKITIGS